MRCSPIHRPRPAGRPSLRGVPKFRIWPKGHPEEAVTIQSPFAETAVLDARRRGFGDEVELEWREVR